MSAPERIWTRDVDGTESQHPCLSGDDGAIEWVRVDAHKAAVAAARASGLVEGLRSAQKYITDPTAFEAIHHSIAAVDAHAAEAQP